MTITGCIILPHGAITLRAPKDSPTLESCERLHSACQLASKSVVSVGSPSIVLLITPHGISSEVNFAVYLNHFAEGDAEWDGDWKEFRAKCAISLPVSKSLITHLSPHIKIDGITAFAEVCGIPLRWGEVVPLWFLHQNLPNHSSVQHVIISVPKRRMEHGAEMIPELEELGSLLVSFFHPLKENVIVAISGDLAHKHWHSIPHHPTPYGVNENSEHFDALIEKWAKNPRDRQSLIDASKMLNDVRSCGFTGFVILNRILEKLREERDWVNKVLTREHPTYYGMLVVAYIPI